jgi:hypothetical protein
MKAAQGTVDVWLPVGGESFPLPGAGFGWVAVRKI